MSISNCVYPIAFHFTFPSLLANSDVQSVVRRFTILFQRHRFRIGIKNRPTKRQYLDDVIAVIQEQKIRFPNVTVKLLLSIARHKDVANAQEMIDVAIEYFQKKPRVVCGVELGGVATKGIRNLTSWHPINHVINSVWVTYFAWGALT